MLLTNYNTFCWPGVKPVSFVLVLVLLTNWVSGGHLADVMAMFIDGKCLFTLIAFQVT